jgi:DNA topoisomerase-1
VLGEDPVTGLPVLALTGRYGPFVQLGEMDPGSKEKPKRESLLDDMATDTITLAEALQLLSLPRVVGEGPDGVEITAQNGRYGPYLKKGADSRSLEREEQMFSITLEQAESLFAQPKTRGRRTKPPINELGAHPETGAAVRVLDGRYGPYVTDGTINATVPRGVDPATVNLEEAVELLREREARGPAKKATKKATKKKATAKKAPAKKTTAKKKPSPLTRNTVPKGSGSKAARHQRAGSGAPRGDEPLA